MVDRAIDGLSDETLARQISDSDNSIGWLLFPHEPGGGRFHECQVPRQASDMDRGRLVREIRPERRPGDDRPRLGHGAPGRVAASLQRRPGRVLRGHEGLLPGLYVLRDRRGVECHHEPEAGADPEPKETIMGVLVFDNIVHGGQIAFLRGTWKHGLVRLARTQAFPDNFYRFTEEHGESAVLFLRGRGMGSEWRSMII